jgi:hypothetical protein
MTNFSEWYMRVEDDDLGSVHDCVWDDDYCKARDVQSILEEAFEAGYDKALQDAASLCEGNFKYALEMSKYILALKETNK